MPALAAALARFAVAYNARPDLAAQLCGWSRTIRLESADTREAVAIRVEDGRIVGAGAPTGSADLVITSDAATLCDILDLRRGPADPYLFGELTVRGPEADLMRLDYVTEALCPR